jgi:ABC-type transporter Mla subunit MlaD
MSDQNNNDSSMSTEELKSYVEEVIISLSKLTDSRIKEIDDKLESFEKQIATLVVGFGEQAVFLEALLAQISFATEDQQKVFQNNVSQARRELLKVMQDGSKTLVAQQDERLASAINDVVESKSSDL